MSWPTTLARRGGMSRDEVRELDRGGDDALARRRVRVGERAGRRCRALRELGLVTRDDWDELELRVAQLEHRLRLVETAPQPAAAATSRSDRLGRHADLAGTGCPPHPREELLPLMQD